MVGNHYVTFLCLLFAKTITGEMTSGLKIVDVTDVTQKPHLIRHDNVMFRCPNPNNTTIESVTVHSDGLENTNNQVAEIRMKLDTEHIFVTAFCFYQYKNGSVSPHHIRHYSIVVPPTFSKHTKPLKYEVVLGHQSEIIVTFVSNPPIHHSHIHIRSPKGTNFAIFRLSHQRGGYHRIHMRFVEVYASELGRYVITLNSTHGVAREEIFLVDDISEKSIHRKNKIIGSVIGVICGLLVIPLIYVCYRKCRANKEFHEALINDEAYVAGRSGRDDVFLSVQETSNRQLDTPGALENGAPSNDREITFLQRHDNHERKDHEMQEISQSTSTKAIVS